SSAAPPARGRRPADRRSDPRGAANGSGRDAGPGPRCVRRRRLDLEVPADHHLEVRRIAEPELQLAEEPVARLGWNSRTHDQAAANVGFGVVTERGGIVELNEIDGHAATGVRAP